MYIKRVLFDFDGTLFDTQTVHAILESEILAQHGITIRPEIITDRYAGTPTYRVFMDLLKCNREEAHKLEEQKWKKAFAIIDSAEPLHPDLAKLFETLGKYNIRMSIGTASPARWAKEILERHNLLHFFELNSIVGGDMVTNGKPSPEIWIRAALDTPHPECFVVEDGIAGIEGALNAGMMCALLKPRTREGAFPFDTLEDLLTIVKATHPRIAA